VAVAAVAEAAAEPEKQDTERRGRKDYAEGAKNIH
jgi:hypothetical protein